MAAAVAIVRLPVLLVLVMTHDTPCHISNVTLHSTKEPVGKGESSPTHGSSKDSTGALRLLF